MAVYKRIQKIDGYTMMSNYHLRDMNLSLKRIAVFGIIPSCRLEIFGIRFDSYRKRRKECSHVCAERVRGEWISE